MNTKMLLYIVLGAAGIFAVYEITKPPPVAVKPTPPPTTTPPANGGINGLLAAILPYL
jgi:hypothetical protein